jgi:hypothetical protein
MHPTTEAKETDPNHVLIAAADEQLARAHEAMESADEQLTRMQEQLSKLERGAARSRLRPTRDRPWLRGLAALLVAACIFAAALASQSSNGDAVTQWAPQLISALSLSAEKLGFPARVNLTSAQLTAAEPHYTGPTGPTSPEPAQLLQTMARDLANVEQEIEQLKASQQELASNNAKAIEQIKASQEESARDNAKSIELLRASQEHSGQLVARPSEQNLRPKTSAAQPRPIATATRKPVPTAASPHASARPQAPMQLRPEEQ